MIWVDGESNERLVLDGEWFEKQRGGEPKTRVPAASFRGVELKDVDRKKKLFGGERERLVQATLSFDGGPFVGFVTWDDKRADLQAVLDGLEAARQG